MYKRYLIGWTIACWLLLTLAAPITLPRAQTTTKWRGEYFQNQNLEGSPAATQDDTSIDFDWGVSGPFSGWPVDHWSVRWTKSDTFDAGTYVFSTHSDDGARVYVDGSLIIDNWVNYRTGIVVVGVNLTAGTHKVVVEYYEDVANATIHMSYYKYATGGPYWKGEYFQNQNLAGPPSLVRWDDAITMDWDSEAPIPGWSRNHFSVRWTRVEKFNAATYIFSVGNDDGARMYIDGERIIDDWRDGEFRWNTVNKTMTAGTHTVVVEYYEDMGTARVQAGFYSSVPMATASPSPTAGPSPTPTRTKVPTPITPTVTLRPANTRVPTATLTLTPTLPYLAGTQSTTLAAPTPAPASLDNGIFASDSDPKLFTWSGFPGPSAALGGESGQYYYAKNRLSVDTVEAQWHFEPQQAGYYNVFAFIPAATEAATQYATYFVHASGRVSAPIIIDQDASSAQWMPLGSYYFTPGYPGQLVYLDNVTGEPSASRLVLFDDVVFVPGP